MTNPYEELKKRQQEQHDRESAEYHKRMRQDEQQRHNRELEVIQSREASSLGENAHAIQKLITMVEGAPDQEMFQPSLHELGFAENLDSRGRARRLLSTLTKKRCFANCEIAGNNNFTLKKPNLRKLKNALRIAITNEAGDGRVAGLLKRWNTPFSAIAAVFAIIATAIQIYGIIRDYNIQGEVEQLRNRIEQIEETRQIQQGDAHYQTTNEEAK